MHNEIENFFSKVLNSAPNLLGRLFSYLSFLVVMLFIIYIIFKYFSLHWSFIGFLFKLSILMAFAIESFLAITCYLNTYYSNQKLTPLQSLVTVSATRTVFKVFTRLMIITVIGFISYKLLTRIGNIEYMRYGCIIEPLYSGVDTHCQFVKDKLSEAFMHPQLLSQLQPFIILIFFILLSLLLVGIAYIFVKNLIFKVNQHDK